MQRGPCNTSGSEVLVRFLPHDLFEFQMSKMLLTGEIKSAKTILKNLQSTVTLITQESNSLIYCPEDNLKR